VYVSLSLYKTELLVSYIITLSLSQPRWEQVPELRLFANNTAAFIHDLDAAAKPNVAGDSNTSACKCAGHANTNAEIAALARAALEGR